MVTTINILYDGLQLLSRHGSLYQNFYNRQTAFSIFASGQYDIPLNLNSARAYRNTPLRKVSYINSSTAFHVLSQRSSP
jgi:hypothetical protein